MAEPNQPPAKTTAATVAAMLQQAVNVQQGRMGAAAPDPAEPRRFKVTKDGQEFWVEVRELLKDGV